jgi:TolB-like protein/Tfp pilus assembly protein PilF
MASLFPGYEYDIFISYRQKDNKYDGWVTDFVDHLKRELEATFKEEISVYFDINPHDGLLEIHEVNASLREKLKCLVFIPIISQTYCDIKSFAWQHEFCAFNQMLKEDPLGRDIRLAGGNVASRILPIKIHDLDPEDKTLLENELGGALRCIEFIFRSAGVNRPLNPSDNPDKNLNKTFYRDQINKVANAVKEIITAIKKHNRQDRDVRIKVVKIKPVEDTKSLKPGILIGSLLMLALIVLAYFFFSNRSESSNPVEKSIAVLPFKNDSPDEEDTYFINSIMEEVLNNLQTIKDLRVVSRNSVDQYKDPEKASTTEIAKKLDVNYIVIGSGQKNGSTIRVRVKLIEAKNARQMWADSYDKEINETQDIFSIQSQIAEAIASKLKAIVTTEVKQIIEKIPTADLNAYELYQRGKEEYWKYRADNANTKALENAENSFHKSLKYDSTFAKSYAGLAMVYKDKHQFEIQSSHCKEFLDSVLILANRALFLDVQLAEAYVSKGFYYLASGNSEQALKQFDAALRYNPNDWMAYQYKGYLYLFLNYNLNYVKAIENLQKAVSINKGKELATLLRDLGNAYGQSAGLIEIANKYYREAFILDSDSSLYFLSLASTEMLIGNFKESVVLCNKAYSKDPNNTDILRDFSFYYLFLDQSEKALKYFKKYVDRIEASGQFSMAYINRIGFAYWNNGYKKKGDYYFREQINNAEETISKGRLYYPPYRLAPYYDLAGTYACIGEKKKAYENLRVWTRISVCPLWGVVLIKKDPLFNSIRNEPEFQQIVREVEAKYQSEHTRVMKWLEEKGKV